MTRPHKILLWGPSADAIRERATHFGPNARVVMRPDLDTFVQHYFQGQLAADVIMPARISSRSRRALARASTIAAGGRHVSLQMKNRHPAKGVTLNSHGETSCQ